MKLKPVSKSNTIVSIDADMRSVDLAGAQRFLPPVFRQTMERPEWRGKIFVAGGYLRAITRGELPEREEEIDIDVFVRTPEDADRLRRDLRARCVHKTDVSFSIRDWRPVVQIIRTWNFGSLESVMASFDFSCVQAAIACFEGGWVGRVGADYYAANDENRLSYLHPERDNGAGRSLMRVLKLVRRGYKIAPEEFSSIIVRAVLSVPGFGSAVVPLIDTCATSESWLVEMLAAELKRSYASKEVAL